MLSADTAVQDWGIAHQPTDPTAEPDSGFPDLTDRAGTTQTAGHVARAGEIQAASGTGLLRAASHLHE